MMRNFSTIFFLIHIFISPGLAITLDQNVGPLAVQDLFFPGFNETYHLPGHVLFNVEPKRFRRSTDDPLNTVIQRMQTLSSVTNAVALQIGLLADTIPHYDVIAELLHFDHVKLSDFKNPIANDVETILNSFATLPDQFEKDVTNVLTAFESLLGINKQISGVKDVKSWNSEQTLQSDLEDLEANNGFDLKSYEDIEKSVRCIPSNIDTLERFKKRNKEEDSKGTFSDFSQCIEELISEPANFQKKINSIVKLKSGGKAVDSFSDMLTLSRTIKKCKDDEQKLKFKPEGKNKLSNNIALVSTVSEQSLQLSSYLETVLKVLAASTTTTSYRALVYTAGLPDGFEDLKSVPFHKSDTWLESITDTTSLFKALTILDLFIEKVRDVSQQLSFYRGQKPSPIDTVNSFVKSLDSSSLLNNDADPVLKEMFRLLSIIPKSPKSPQLVDLEPLNKEIAKIDTAVESIRASMGKSIGLLTNNEFVTMIKEIQKISGKAAPLTDKAKLKELIEELLNYGKKPQLDQKFLDFTTQFNNVKTEVSNLKTLAKDVKIQLTDTMTKFQTSWDDFKNFLDGLRNLDDTKVDDVKKLIARSQNLQTPMPDSVKREVSKVVDVVTKLQTMTDLSAVISSMKSQETEETKQFSDLVDSEKLSEVIGTATRGIVNFKDLSERKSQFELIQRLLLLMETDISTRQGLTQPEIEAPMELKKLQKMSGDLEKWRSGVKLPNPDTIPNYADIFVGGLDLTSEDINEPIKLSETLGNLESTTADPNAKKNLLEIKTALDELNSVGVKLSVYKDAVTKTRDTLNSLNTYFANHQKKVVTIPVQKATPLSILTSTGFLEVTTIAGSWASNNVGLIIFFAFLAIGLLAGGASAIAYCCCGWRPCQKKKKKGEMNKGEKIPLIEPATPPPKQSVIKVDETKKDTPNEEKGEKDNEPDKKNDKSEVKVEPELVVPKKSRVPIKRDQRNIPSVVYINFMLQGIKKTLLEYQVKKGRSPDDLLKETLIYYCSTNINLIKDLDMTRKLTKRRSSQVRNGHVYLKEDEVVWLLREFINKVYHEDHFINGQAYTHDNDSIWYLCETPIVPTPKNPNRTDDKFALLVAQVEAEAVVFICDSSELKSKSEPTYGEYFPKEAKDKLEIELKPNIEGIYKEDNKPKLVMTCLSKDSLCNGQLIVRRIHIKFKDLKKAAAPVKKETNPYDNDKYLELAASRYSAKTQELTGTEIKLREEVRDTVKQKEAEKLDERQRRQHEFSYFDLDPNDIDVVFTHYQLTGWKAGSVPEDTVPVIKLLMLLREKANVILHCSDGIERCGTLTYIESLRQECARKWKFEDQSVQIDYYELARKVTQIRPGALSLYIHKAFSMMTLVDIVKSTYKPEKNASDLQAAETYAKLHELYGFALNNREAVDPKKDGWWSKMVGGLRKMVERKEAKKPTETVEAPKSMKKAAETRIEVDNTQDSDPLLEKPSLKEQKTQEPSN